jgi:hypothetical protein
MKLLDLQKLINQCVDEASGCNPDVDFYYGKSTELEIDIVTQFEIVPDVTIKFKKVKYHDKSPK